MPSIQQRASKGIDWVSVTIYISLVMIGWLMLYAVNYDPQSSTGFFDFNDSVRSQGLWILISFFFFGLSFTLDWKFWNTFSFLVYAISIALLLLVLVFGTNIKGAKSWFILFGFSFQPSELAKFGTALAIASYTSLSNVSILKSRRNLFQAFGLFLLPMLLIGLQPDAGSAVVFLSFMILFYRLGLNELFYVIALSLFAVIILSFMYGPYIVMLIASMIAAVVMSIKSSIPRSLFVISLALPVLAYMMNYLGYLNYFLIPLALHLAVVIFLNLRNRNYNFSYFVGISLTLALVFSISANWAFNNVLQAHQQDRINVWLRPDKCDPRGSLYNIIQSKTAIGSGGISGKGFLKGSMTQLNFIPEQQTDFIFAAIGEEQGFIGILGVVVLFFVLLIRMVRIAERARNNFVRNYTYAIAGILFVHVLVNIGMTMGLMPVIGIPLPYISKGGSSMLIFSIMLGVLLKMDMDRSKSL